MNQHSPLPARIIAARKARPFDREVFSLHAYWHDGEIVCGGCDYPVIDAKCERCEVAFVGEPPVEPVPTYSERRQAWHDSHSVPAEDVVRLILAPRDGLPIINNLGREGVML